MSVTLLNIDCMEYMAGLPDKAFDLAIVDVPYGINIASQGKIGNCSPFGNKKSFGEKNTRNRIIPSKDYGKKSWDRETPGQDYFNELFRVSINQIIWGANHIGHMAPSSCWIVWDKENSGNYAEAELAYTSFKTVVRVFKFRWNGMLQGDMKNKEHRIHPTQKPVALYKWLIQNYAKQGDKILDTHLGSGSSAIAAEHMGFDFVGCELDKDYYTAACKRFKEQTAQIKIF